MGEAAVTDSPYSYDIISSGPPKVWRISLYRDNHFCGAYEAHSRWMLMRMKHKLEKRFGAKQQSHAEI
jgi:hypothetical protein